MTTGELIAVLAAYPPDTPVAIWQEDCNDGWYTPDDIRLDPAALESGAAATIWTRSL